MPIDYDTLMAWPFPDRVHAYSPDDTILYALGIGMGGTDEELPFVYEDGLRAVPTMAVVLAHPGFWMRDSGTGITWRRLLHRDQSLTMFRPLPPAATVKGRTWVSGLADRGVGRGALLSVTREVSDAENGEVLCRMDSTYLLRDDGGFGGPLEMAVAPADIPLRKADTIGVFHTSVRSSLIYRLSGDKNPLHVDPRVAAAAGFSGPILHGLCTFGIAARGILAGYCDNWPERLASLQCRFTAPVYPGETIRMEMWKDGSHVAFRAHSMERSVVVLDHGKATVC
ncbi:MaoC/PaaZ C-terminal domain-containing protein [Magnetospirillum sp. 15-1]|uniref:MaoC/PaaZ C-terminal domain-containing protein n=1 Tax=Magnetospirillum sp. 15-1 TaxID=1979370 RepID=UPI000BBC1735|nr:MaoC/PaaZ C-terminal domain-containing protein [Magnetospirillum sp. 15-1]